MDFVIIISFCIGFISLIGAFILEGGHLASLIQPTAALIVFGGTIGAIGASFPGSILKKIPSVLAVAFKTSKDNRKDLLFTFIDISTNSRKNGLLSIEPLINSGSFDPFTQKGLQLVIDGIDPQNVKKILESKLENISDRHHSYAAIFEAAGGYSPTMGIIGTVLGLVHVLGNLANPGDLGPQIAVAFIATLYGVGTANILWLPLANKLKQLDAIEVLNKSMIIEAILLIQEGVNPKALTEKLQGYLDEEVTINE